VWSVPGSALGADPGAKPINGDDEFRQERASTVFWLTTELCDEV
jgi:hypothetical protein